MPWCLCLLIFCRGRSFIWLLSHGDFDCSCLQLSCHFSPNKQRKYKTHCFLCISGCDHQERGETNLKIICQAFSDTIVLSCEISDHMYDFVSATNRAFCRLRGRLTSRAFTCTFIFICKSDVGTESAGLPVHLVVVHVIIARTHKHKEVTWAASKGTYRVVNAFFRYFKWIQNESTGAQVTTYAVYLELPLKVVGRWNNHVNESVSRMVFFSLVKVWNRSMGLLQTDLSSVSLRGVFQTLGACSCSMLLFSFQLVLLKETHSQTPTMPRGVRVMIESGAGVECRTP